MSTEAGQDLETECVYIFICVQFVVFPTQSVQTEQLKSVNITTLISVWRKKHSIRTELRTSVEMFSNYLKLLDLTEFHTIDAYSSLGLTTEKYRINKISRVDGDDDDDDDDNNNNLLGVENLLKC